MHCALPLLLLTAALPAQPPSAARLFGRVVDERGEPVAGAEVTTLRRDETLPWWFAQQRFSPLERVRTVRADDRGQFSIPLESNGLVAVFAAVGDDLHSGFRCPAVAGEFVDLIATPTTRWTGRVLDEKAAPLPGARVRVLMAVDNAARITFGLESFFINVHAEVGTDDRGRFEFTAPRDARLFVQAQHERGSAVTLPLARDPGDLTLTIEPNQPVHGQVVDAETGDPVPDAHIFFGSSASSESPVTSDAEGRFVLPTPPIGFAPVVDSPRHRIAVAPVHGWTHRTADAPLRVAVRAGHRLTARLLRADGSPVAEAPVLAMTTADGSQASFLIERRTDASGRVELCGIEPRLASGAYVHLDGGWVRFCRVPAEGDHDLGELRLDPSFRVTGRVQDVDGAPAALTPVLLEPVDSPGTAPAIGDARLTRTDASGRFAFTGLLPGRFAVAAYSAGSRLTVTTVDAHREPEPLDLELQAGKTIAGIVVHASGEPSAGSTVRAYVGEPRVVSGFAVPGLSVRTDAQGRFSLPCLLDLDAYNILAGCFEHPSAVGVASAVAPGTHDIEITLSR